MDEINFEIDSFSDIVSVDPRYAGRAYAFLMSVLACRSRQTNGGRVTADAILDEFKELALLEYGPMAYTVLTEWGVSSTDDIGEMMANLVESKRLTKNDEDNFSDFNGGYDFKEAFLDPYQT